VLIANYITKCIDTVGKQDNDTIKSIFLSNVIGFFLLVMYQNGTHIDYG